MRRDKTLNVDEILFKIALAYVVGNLIAIFVCIIFMKLPAFKKRRKEKRRKKDGKNNKDD